MKHYLGRMKNKGNACPPRHPWHKIVWSWLGSFLGIYLVGFLGAQWRFLTELDIVFLIGSFGASAVLIYGLPMADLAQPRNFVGGHAVSATMGVLVYALCPHTYPVFAAALAVSLAVAAMHITRTLHPPGGATALIAVIGSDKVHDLGLLYIACPVLAGCLIMLVVALLVNNLSGNPKRHYPVYWY